MEVTFCITCCDKDIHLLDKCLEYVLNQTIAPDEIVVVCSGLGRSKMDYEEVLAKARKHNFVFYNHPSRRLPGWARNTGALISTGEVTVFCDVDDSIHPQKCKFMKDVFSSRPEVSAVVSNYHLPASFGGWDWMDTKRCEVEEITEVEPPPEPTPERWFDIPRTNVMAPSRTPVHHGHMSCRTDMLLSGKVRYDEEMPLGEDGTFCRSILEHPQFRLFYTPEKLIIYN